MADLSPRRALAPTRHQARIILATEDSVAVGFSLGITEILELGQEQEAVGHLGPICSGPIGTVPWRTKSSGCRLRTDRNRAPGSAGDGRTGQRVPKAICFLRGIHPKTPTHLAGNLDAIVDLSFRTINVNKSRRIRVTTGDTAPVGRHGCTADAKTMPPLRNSHQRRHPRTGSAHRAKYLLLPDLPALHAWLALISSLTQWRTNRSRSTTIVPSR